MPFAFDVAAAPTPTRDVALTLTPETGLPAASRMRPLTTDEPDTAVGEML